MTHQRPQQHVRRYHAYCRYGHVSGGRDHENGRLWWACALQHARVHLNVNDRVNGRVSVRDHARVNRANGCANGRDRASGHGRVLHARGHVHRAHDRARDGRDRMQKGQPC